MFSILKTRDVALSADDKARAINLALFLETYNYEEMLLKMVLAIFSIEERKRIYSFWNNLTPATHRAYLCMKEVELWMI